MAVKPPSDIFTTQVAPALDVARQEIANVGLRPYRSFFLTEKWEGPAKHQGDLIEAEWEEILPPPVRVEVPQGAIAENVGLLQVGAIELQRISRVYTREQLMGRGVNGDDLPENWLFSYVLAPLGQIHGWTYVPSASEPMLRPTEWRVRLNPTNSRRVLPTPDP